MNSEFSAIRVFVAAVLLNSSVLASMRGTPHDLSALGKRDVCRFCHTPHSAVIGRPGWSHKLSNSVYKIYQSSSLDAKVGQPTGDSKLCLSCHDGTVALTHTTRGGVGGVYITPGTANLGTDLSDDHPISFVYSDALSAEDSQIRPASTLGKEFKLDRSGELQCTTCHNAHKNDYGNFLVVSNQRSQMCISCHDLYGWVASSHESSTVSVFASSDTYLKKSEYGSVADNGCLSCHRPHSAGGAERLLHFAESEKNCLNCHDGSVAGTNLKLDLDKFSGHKVRRYRDVHDLRESPVSSSRHVECVDCHNPHAMQPADVAAPAVRGAMQGITGVTISGSPAQHVQ
jgi:predicted CXXCH cytochrome family protein